MSAGGDGTHRLARPGAAADLANTSFAALQVARHFFRNFGARRSHGWLDAFAATVQNLACPAPAAIPVAVRGVVQAMLR